MNYLSKKLTKLNLNFVKIIYLYFLKGINMKKEDIGILGKLVADNFNSMTEPEQKEELEKKFGEVVKKMHSNHLIYSNIAKDVVVNDAILEVLKGFHFENNSLPKSYSVSMEDLEKMLVSSGNNSALEKIKLMRNSASGNKNKNNNNDNSNI